MTQDYENSPACEMLESRCAICGRKLVDAISVECGTGPICQAKYLSEGDEAARKAANKLCYEAGKIYLAARKDDETRVQLAGIVAKLREIGFEKVADKIAKHSLKPRRYTVEIAREAGAVQVSTAYSASFRNSLLNLGGCRWDSAGRCWNVPEDKALALHRLLKRAFPGELAKGPKGEFVL